MKNIGTSFIAGVVGAIATAVVAWLLGVFPLLYNSSIDHLADAVIRRFELTLRPNAGGLPSNLIAACDKNELLVGGFCQVNKGTGTLQNAGVIQNATGYNCVWDNLKNDSTGAPFNATAYAECLRRR